MQKKKAISLIVLVITIIVMVILAGTIIISINNNGIIEKTTSAVKQNNLKEVQTMAQMAWAEGYLANKRGVYLNEYIIAALEDNNVDMSKYYVEVTSSGAIVYQNSSLVGTYVEYNVAYTDVAIPGNEYSALNGWRIFSAIDNGDGTYSRVKLISTGMPIYLGYSVFYSSQNSGWWVTDSAKLNEYVNILKQTGGDGSYDCSNFQDGIKIAAGAYYNLETKTFRYGVEDLQPNQGYFTKVVTSNVEYSATSNSSTERTGGQLFNLFGNNAKVRLVTLPEVNLFIGRNDIDSMQAIPQEKDSLGLFRLASLSSVPNMTNFTAYTNEIYWISSPRPSSAIGTLEVVRISPSGSITSSISGSSCRPLIVLNSNVKVRLTDTNSNGVPEIQVVN